jgi:N-methylhydantoinase B
VRRYKAEPGDVVVLETGGGGGWGDPRERSTELIKRDLRRGYITAEAAERDYGVRVTGDKVERT